MILIRCASCEAAADDPGETPTLTDVLGAYAARLRSADGVRLIAWISQLVPISIG